jgi:hypothetical protein
LRPRKTAKN